MAKILVFPDGSEEIVVSDDGRYWITEGSRYSKSNADIRVKRVSDEEIKGQNVAGENKKSNSSKKETAKK